MPFAPLPRFCARGHAAGRRNLVHPAQKKNPRRVGVLAVARLGSLDSIALASPYTFFGKHALKVTPLTSPPSVFAYKTPSGSMFICTTLLPSVDAPAK